jgi:beta-exotoxin I transport system permease protein
MLRNVTLKTLRDLARGLVWWSLGLVALVALIAGVFPTVRDNTELNQLAQSYPEAIKGLVSFGGVVDYTSGPGYLGSELFAFMVPLLFLVAAIGAGSRAIGGEEERGTLDLLLALPLSRRRLVVEKLAALLGELVVLGLVLWLAVVVASPLVDLGISAGHAGAAVLNVVALAFAFGAIALLVGAATGHRARAIGITAALAIGAYLVSSLSTLVGFLDQIKEASPFFHYAATNPLRSGLEGGHLAFSVAVAAVAGSAAPLLFERRDLT